MFYVSIDFKLALNSAMTTQLVSLTDRPSNYVEIHSKMRREVSHVSERISVQERIFSVNENE